MNVKSIRDLPSETLKVKRTGEMLSIAQFLSGAFSLSTLLVHRETIPVGRRASSPHYHSEKEEIFIVESGSPSLWVEGTIIQLKPGDVIGFAPGKPARMIINKSDQPAIIYTIGANSPNDEVIYIGT